MTSSPSPRPSRRAKVDLPEPPEPITSTLFMHAPGRSLCFGHVAVGGAVAAGRVVALEQFDELARGGAEGVVAAVDGADGALPLGLGQRDDGELTRAPLVEHGG